MLTIPSDLTPVGTDGFVQLIDIMGSDQRVVDAARVSYGKHRAEHDPDRDEKLIRYMMRHGHTSPFEQCEMAFVIRIQMDAWRQMVRHRTANVNEYSTRYTQAIDSRHVVAPEDWRLQSGTNKQGSRGMLGFEEGALLSRRQQDFHDLAQEVYEQRLEFGVAREQARMDLPLSTYTELYWKCDLHNIFHFLGLRTDSHAQLEIREYANAIAQFVRLAFPMSWRAWCDYKRDVVTLTALDLRTFQMTRDFQEPMRSAWMRHGGSEREIEEFKHKIAAMGMTP